MSDRWLLVLVVFLVLGRPSRGAKPLEDLPVKLAGATVYIESQVVLAGADWEALPAKAREALGKRPQYPASGSGFLVSADGLILTNAHVIGASKQTVQLAPTVQQVWHFLPTALKVVVRSGEPGERSFVPRVLKVDVGADLALLKIPPQPDLTPLALLPTPDLVAGAAVYMAGFPGGKLPDMAPFMNPAKKIDYSALKNPKVSINAGMITAVREHEKQTIYQLDIRANPGNSGGPIVNEAGEVVAVLSAGLPSLQSINYAIPAKYLRQVLPKTLGGDATESPAEASDGQSFDAFKASGTFKLTQ